MSGEGALPGLQMDSYFLFPHTVDRNHLSSVSSCKGTNPIEEAPPSSPHHLPKASPPKTITLGIRASMHEL